MQSPSLRTPPRLQPSSAGAGSSGRRKRLDPAYHSRLGGAYAARASPRDDGRGPVPFSLDGKRRNPEDEDQAAALQAQHAACSSSPSQQQQQQQQGLFGTPRRDSSGYMQVQVPSISPGHTLPGGGGESLERRRGSGDIVYSDRFIPCRSATRLEDTSPFGDENEQAGADRNSAQAGAAARQDAALATDATVVAGAATGAVQQQYSAAVLNDLMRTQLLGEEGAARSAGTAGVLKFKAQRQNYGDDVKRSLRLAPRLALSVLVCSAF
jgi:hypothetical protein